jgi:flavodoxin
MKAVIVLYSYHHMNTEKVARTIASNLGAEIKTLEQTDPSSLSGYDLVGFGSGVYFGKLGKNLLGFADRLPQVTGKKAFIFSTSGRTGKAAAKFHAPLKEKLLSKGFSAVGEFNCAGFDTFGALRIMGGINKGRPNEEDLKQAEAFAQSLKQDPPKP